MQSIILSVEADSPLRHRARAGDVLVAIDGHPVEDVLDYEYWGCGERQRVTLRRGKREFTVRARRSDRTGLGLNFEEFLMDRPKACANHCVFCFVDQLPKGLRKPLYFKDDDARLSFLTGSYITLTNLSERELERIIQLKVSPVNVSVHATEPALRARLLGTSRGAEGYERMRRLAAGGICMNCQIVICPGWNDGEALERTMEDLAALWPQVPSVSLVPVGLTEHRAGLTELTAFDRERAAAVIAQADRFGEECLRRFGSRIFFCADELYLKAGLPIPPEEYYEDYPQIENGVGLMRSEEEEFLPLAGSVPAAEDFCVATGVSAAPYIRRLLEKAGSDAPVYAIENDFFGHTIDVAGLITGGDLIRQLQGRPLRRRLLIPQVMLRHGGDVFLDDVTPAQVEQALGVQLVPVINDGEALFRAVTGRDGAAAAEPNDGKE